MKHIIIIVIAISLASAAYWYSSENDVPVSQHMDTKSALVKSDLTKLPEHAVEEVRPTEIVELEDGATFDLEATIVKQEVGNRIIKRLAYNGQIPGPALKVQKGSKITVNFKNSIDMETALHSHGLRGDYLMDGAVPITPAIEVGESFSYELEFPDTGVYWYHPHVREDYQQELGLYGNFIVEEKNYWNPVSQEEYLIFDDILESGDFQSGVVSNTLMGRFGDTLLINDKEDFELRIEQGEIARIFITNVANTRTFDLDFEGTKMKLVGGDLGRIENEVMVEDLIIAPAERYVVEIMYEEVGAYDITHRGDAVGRVLVGNSAANNSLVFNSLRSNLRDYSDIRSQISNLLTQSPDKSIRLDVEMKGMLGNMMKEMTSSESGKMTMGGDEEMMREHCKVMPEMSGCEPYLSEKKEPEKDLDHNEEGIEWEDDMIMMNQMSTDENVEWIIEDQDTGKKNGDIDWSFKKGDLVKVRVYNDENGMHPMQHPLHFHGQRFVVLARDGEISPNLQWKDTVLIPKGQTVDLLVDMSNPGKWMAHCHIAEHLHSGMMFNFNVN